jgi:hypothetical protein
LYDIFTGDIQNTTKQKQEQIKHVVARFNQCTSHGNSEVVKAATLLHKAMKYETTRQRRKSQNNWEDRQRRQEFLCDINLGICNTTQFAPYQVRDWINNPLSRIFRTNPKQHETIISKDSSKIRMSKTKNRGRPRRRPGEGRNLSPKLYSFGVHEGYLYG